MGLSQWPHGGIRSQCRHARDAWRIHIGGAGKLTKDGSGTPVLAGTNTYTGGTEIVNGVLQANGESALGDGAVYVRAGTLVSHADAPLTVKGTYVHAAQGALQVNVGADGAGQVKVDETATIDGALVARFRDGYVPRVGETITVLLADRVQGIFASLDVAGFRGVINTYGQVITVTLLGTQ